MRCPECRSPALKTVNSRHREGAVWRRRKCEKCNYVFTTIEVIHTLRGGRPRLEGDKMVHTIIDAEVKDELTQKSQKWLETVESAYPAQDTPSVVENMAKLLLNKSKKISREELVQMLNFNLADTQAGQDLIQIGEKKGEINNAREMLLEALEVKFGIVSEKIVEQINQLENLRILKSLHRMAIQINGYKTFEIKMTEALAQV